MVDYSCLKWPSEYTKNSDILTNYIVIYNIFSFSSTLFLPRSIKKTFTSQRELLVQTSIQGTFFFLYFYLLIFKSNIYYTLPNISSHSAFIENAANFFLLDFTIFKCFKIQYFMLVYNNINEKY